MADRYEGGTYPVEGGAPPGRSDGLWSFASALIGTALLVALIGGIVWWAVGLGEREAESLPVFRAGVTPTKMRPADPGGAETPYQRIRSYEVATGAGETKAQTKLAPPPATPTGEDLAMGELAAATPSSEPDLTDLPGAESARTEAVPAESTIRRRPDPLAPPGPDRTATAPADATVQPALEASAVPVEVGPAPRATPVAPRRPKRRTPAASAKAAAAGVAPSQASVDRAAQLALRAAVSPIQIELGAYSEKSATEDHWRRISAANSDLLDGRALAVQPAGSGGKRRYHLRVGPFADRDEARRICRALKDRGEDCAVADNG